MHPPTQKYVIIGFPQQQWFDEHALTLHDMCIACVVATESGHLQYDHSYLTTV